MKNIQTCIGHFGTDICGTAIAMLLTCVAGWAQFAPQHMKFATTKGFKMKTLLLTLVCSLSSLNAFAEHPPGRGENVRAYDLEVRVQRLEQENSLLDEALRRLESRVAQIEDGGRRPPGPGPRPPRPPGPPPPPPYYPPASEVACLLVDSGYTKTFLGKGRNQLEAELNARNSCGQSVHSSYCGTSAKITCDSERDRYGRGWLCVVIDSGYSKSFSGEAQSRIEAEALAKMQCQKSVHSSYCGNVTARCEPIR